jgi:hypothetical protein
MAIRYVLQPTKNHNARIASKKNEWCVRAATTNRDDGFDVEVYSDAKGNGKKLVISQGGQRYDSVHLDSRQIQTLLRVLEKHANTVVE